MSHTVLRGEPTCAQRYLDVILDEILLRQEIKPDTQKRDSVTLTQLLFHCLKRAPDAVLMTNGATGEVITNKEILQRVVTLARALVTAGASGKRVMVLARNHQHMLVVYFAVFLAGVIPYYMDPNTTIYELTYFLELIEPCYVFHDKEHGKMLHEALRNTKLKPSVFIVDEPEYLATFVDGFSKDINSYQLPKTLPDDTALFLPTSGSTGLPKAAELTHRGLVIQLPTPWAYHTKFPTPTKLAMILTSNQWMTFTMTITSCVVYHIPILISPKINTVESVTDLLEKYQPTWTFFAPAFISTLIPTITPQQLSSLETVILLGAPSTPEMKNALRIKLRDSAYLCDGYGTTETQGFIALPDRDASINSSGRVINCLDYKIVDEFGKELGCNQTGELLVKGPCIIKKYFKSEKLVESLTDDDWYMTGDNFYLDENERLTFVIRKKFSFKFRGCQVAPEEVERVISSVKGVHESVVCASEKGPAAAVVVRPRALLTKDDIHQAVNASLSEHKHLHGGIVFVPSLPHTHSGKINRGECSKIILDAIAAGDCC